MKIQLIRSIILLVIFYFYFFLCSCKKNEFVENAKLDDRPFIYNGKEYFIHSIDTKSCYKYYTDDNGIVIDTFHFQEWNYTFSLYFNNDTIMQDTLYTYVWYKTEDLNYIIGLIREDEHGKIFFSDNYYSNILLYDFDLTIGDTYYNSYVENVKEVTNCSYRRKELLLTQVCERDTITWIEGIGNTENILYNNFEPFCLKDESGHIITSYTNGGLTRKTTLLFVKSNLEVIYKNLNLQIEPDMFRYYKKIKYY